MKNRRIKYIVFTLVLSLGSFSVANASDFCASQYDSCFHDAEINYQIDKMLCPGPDWFERLLRLSNDCGAAANFMSNAAECGLELRNCLEK